MQVDSLWWEVLAVRRAVDLAHEGHALRAAWAHRLGGNWQDKFWEADLYNRDSPSGHKTIDCTQAKDIRRNHRGIRGTGVRNARSGHEIEASQVE